MFSITNLELVKLDKEVADFYKLNSRFLDNITNLYGRQIYKSQLNKILKEAEKIKPESEFDTLILKNIISNITLNDLFVDFTSDPTFSLSVEEFFSKIAGKDAWDYLENKIRNPPWELIWGFNEIMQKRNLSKVTRLSDESKEAARNWIPKLKEDILNYGKYEGYLYDNFDMTILLLPPRERGENSNWDPFNKIFNLGFYGFEFFIEDGKIIANPTLAYQVAFHEIFGHAVHQINSENLPLSVRFSNEIGYITPTKSITEGVAINRELHSHKFLRERLTDLRLKEEDIKFLEILNQIQDKNISEEIYGGLIKDKEFRENGFDSYRHILELTNNPITARFFKQKFESYFIDVWSGIGHTLGKFHYNKMEDLVKEKFGEKYLEKDKKRFYRATTNGVWSWEVYPEAVCYFFKNL